MIFQGNILAEEAYIKNNKLKINFNTKKGTWNCSSITGDKIISNAEFLIITEKGEKYYSSSKKYNKTVKKSAADDILGPAQKLEIQFSSEENNIPEATLSIYLYNDKNFLSLEVEVKNISNDKIIIKEIQPVKLHNKNYLYFKGSPDKLSCMTNTPSTRTELIFLNEKGKIASYSNIALYNLESKKSLIAGFLDHRKAFNLMALRLANKKSAQNTSFEYTASSYYVYCSLNSGESVSTGRMTIEFPDDVFEGLERYAKFMAKVNNITLKEKPLCGWCSWYYIYPNITEEEVIKNLNFLAENLKDYGLEYIQIDRGYTQTGYDWITYNSKFPHGMKWIAEQIHNKGFKAGLWFSPFWLGRDSKFYKPEWIYDTINSKPDQERNRVRHWAGWGDALDFSNEEVLGYLKNLFTKVTKEWEYDYLKLDYLQLGLKEEQNLAQVLLEKGEIKDVIKYPRKNMNITPTESYINAMSAIKEAAGDETFIMGCSRTYLHTFGYADAYRVVSDIQTKLCLSWECGTPRAATGVARKYYFNGKIYWNDPDCFVVRAPFTLDQARIRAAIDAFSGGMLMTSDKMYALAPEKLELVKKTLPPYPVSARPIDLFEKEMPEVWLWEIDKNFGKWHVLGVFNYNDEKIVREISYEYLGLDPSKKHILYDFWKKKMPTRSSRYNYRNLMHYSNEIHFELAPMSCFVVAIHEKQPHPQVISTNRHISQGAIDLEDVKWDEQNQKLTGISKLVKNDNYEIVVAIPENFKFIKAEADISCDSHLDDPDVDRYNTVIMKLKSTENRKVKWALSFKDQN
jgi:hypothetical protein